MQKDLKGAYLVRLNLTEKHHLGVANKLRAQVRALSANTHAVDLFYPSGGEILKNNEVVRSYSNTALWRRLTYYLMFYLFIARQSLDVDYLYIRYQRSSPLFLYMLSRLKVSNPSLIILVELPSYPYHNENTSLRDRVFGIVDCLSRPFLQRYVDRIVTFSREKQIFGIPTIRTDNGVDVEALKRLPSPDDTGCLRLLGLANLSFWHGYDRIISGLAQYYAAGNTREVVFDIVGTGAEMERLQHYVSQAGLMNHVRFYGSMHGVPLDNVMAKCHVGISSIGMHRLDVDTSNLKSREFCARGIPFVIAYEDRDFETNLPFVFHAPANDDPVDIKALLAFYETLKEMRPEFSLEMRSYAEKKLTWQAKMAPVLATIRELFAGK